MQPSISKLICLATLIHIGAAIPAPYLQRRAQTDDVAHGNYFEFDSKIWRYHEVGNEMFMGYTIDEWPEHSTSPISSSHVSEATVTDTDLQARDAYLASQRLELESRDAISDVCGTVLTCAANTGANLYLSLCIAKIDIVQALDNAVNAIGAGLNGIEGRPVLVNAATVASGIWAGAIWSNTKSSSTNQAPETCANPPTSHSMSQAAADFICQNSPQEDNAASTNITLPDGSVWELVLHAAPQKDLLNSMVCKAPAPF